MKRFSQPCGWSSLVAVVGMLLLAAPADAHFIFIQIGPHAEAGRGVEVFFSERATAGDPKFVGKISQTELWRQDQPGKFEPLVVAKGTDRLRAPLASGSSVSVVGKCEYGVLKRDKPFLLRYYPKAVSGKPDEIAKLARSEAIPLEIMPTFTADSVTMTVLRNGKPIPNAVITTIDADLTNEELKADSDGRTTWKLPKAGQYAVYVKDVLPQAGQYAVYVKDVLPQAGRLRDDAYEEIREFATLAFDWPLDGVRADPAAIALFEKAIAARAAWPDFKGFAAKVSVYLDGRSNRGRVTVNPDGEVAFTGEPALEDEAAREWLRDQLHSMVIHRVPSSGIAAKPVLSFADTDERHPAGRLLTFHGGRFASTYRVRDDEITVVNRNLGKENMSLQMLESERNPEGKVLPRAYQVQYRDAATATISRVDSFRIRWKRTGKLDLPESLSQTVSNASGVSSRSMELSELELLKE